MKKDRLARVRALMCRDGLDQLIVTQPQAIYYLTGLWCNPMDRLDALVITHDRCRLLCYVLAVIEPEDCEVTIYSDTGVTVDRLGGLLRAGVTGVDGYMHSRFLLPLMQLRSDISFRVSSCVEEARMIKTPEEVALLRRASEITDAVFADAFTRLRPGMTELELGAVFSDGFMAQGVGRFAGDPMVCFGAGSAEPHHNPGNAQLTPGDAVCVDTGKRIDGYYSDMTRTVFFRSCSDEQRRVYDTVLEANLAALSIIRPGVLMSEIHEAACAVIRKAGYGDFYPHRTSHGIGIDYHEEPYDVVGRPLPVEPGMCFSVEPGIYLPGRFGVRIEDLVVVTEDGYSLLNHAPKQLTIIP
ncbi:MAG: aminopeptidase P family protein [Clostridia bacterium]|nr:aminopeptidase P family protein [Clostridia bacterium]